VGRYEVPLREGGVLGECSFKDLKDTKFCYLTVKETQYETLACVLVVFFGVPEQGDESREGKQRVDAISNGV